MHDQYCRVITPEPAINEETEEVCALLQQCYSLRYYSLRNRLDCLSMPPAYSQGTPDVKHTQESSALELQISSNSQQLANYKKHMPCHVSI